MKKQLLTIITSIQLISFFICSILFFILKISSIVPIYEYFYKKYSLAKNIGITDTELILHTSNLLNYLQNKNSFLDATWFTEKDILHMFDVKNLFVLGKSIIFITLFIFLISSIILIINKSIHLSLTLFNKIFFLFILFLFILVFYILINFNSFWINFHLLIFSNDLWLLSPDESNLIKMFPEEFFFYMVSIILCSLILYFIFIFLLVKYIKNKYMN